MCCDADFDIVQEQFVPTADLLFLYPSDSFENRSKGGRGSGVGEAGPGSVCGAEDEHKLNQYEMREAERAASQSILKSVAGLGE